MSSYILKYNCCPIIFHRPHAKAFPPQTKSNNAVYGAQLDGGVELTFDVVFQFFESGDSSINTPFSGTLQFCNQCSPTVQSHPPHNDKLWLSPIVIDLWFNNETTG